MTLTAGEKLAAPLPPRRYRLWHRRSAWMAAAILHVVVIALLLISFQRRQTLQPPGPTGVSVVFEPGAQSTQAPTPGPVPVPAQSAPSASLPPPPPTPPTPQQQTAETEPQVNLNIPQMELAPLPLPQPLPQAPTPAPVHHTQPRPSHRYMVMNNMSFGSGSTLAPQSAPTNQKGLNLNLPQSDADAATAPNVSIQGHVGADWEAGFNKWVYAHLYYPDEAIANNQQGTVTVSFTAHKDGTVTGLRMVSPSGSTFLDQAWFNIFAQNLLPPFPPGSDDTIQITATVQYELK